MKTLLRNLFFGQNFEVLQEGRMAHDYRDEDQRRYIAEAYRRRYCPEPTPLTTPELYDPLAPPPGWAYDPYYEIWTQTQ